MSSRSLTYRLSNTFAQTLLTPSARHKTNLEPLISLPPLLYILRMKNKRASFFQRLIYSYFFLFVFAATFPWSFSFKGNSNERNANHHRFWIKYLGTDINSFNGKWGKYWILYSRITRNVFTVMATLSPSACYEPILLTNEYRFYA